MAAFVSGGASAAVRTRHRPPGLVEHGGGVELAEGLDQPGNQASPPGLVRRAEPGPVVAVEVLVEQQEVAPVRIVLEQRLAAVYRPASVAAAHEGGDETAGQLLGNVEQRHHRA